MAIPAIECVTADLSNVHHQLSININKYVSLLINIFLANFTLKTAGLLLTQI